MVDYIEEIKSIEVRFEKHPEGIRPVLMMFDVHGGVLKESEYDTGQGEATTLEAYKAVIEKMQSIL